MQNMVKECQHLNLKKLLGTKLMFNKANKTYQFVKTLVKPKLGKTDTNQYLLKKAIKDVKTKTEKLREATGKGDK